ncbi:hypothetical protein [Cupriavidus necator]|uniref:hypothetical protein n=1 Tax=Cupriavidus necator TaxID=106590 RepID=UPI00068E8124|nr:hypothetical protein [Cupriavidus necator]
MWDSSRLTTAFGRAAETIAFTQGDIADCNQIAMFDPEFGQWHFVPMPFQFDGGGQPNSSTT